ncbi:MAG: LLM class flavin-dependent oxidoreductase [Alphaproteobacteria bacterium]|nr:LLM class flavin-dependent oxidoreductase [Alphaproteobacteria bacterium]MCY4319072.1 LLM class flavin-dependent oxidoreductase [Alphaproteobacteria bacterium]
MIKRFGSLFAGHIDLGDMGQDATLANNRRYSNDELATVFAKTEAMAVCMDRLGYDAFWLAEHHFQHEGYECIPNLPLFFVHLAHKTKRLRFGCGFNVTTMWHPLRLAEDFAVADILTGGRVIFGVGRGYHTREVETLGGALIDGDANRDMFEEQVEIVLRSFQEESFRHEGKYYTLPPRVPYRGYELDQLTLVPRPVNQPVECWQPIVSAQPRGLDFMAKHGIKGIVGGGSALMAERPIVAFKEAWERAGRQVQIGENLCIGLNFHIAETEEKAIREATPFFEEHIKMFAPLGMVPMKPEQLERVSERGDWAELNIPTLKRAVEAGSWYCGPPEGFIAYLEALQAKYPGLEDVNVQSSMGTPLSVMIEQLEIFGTEVMAPFRVRQTARAT